MAKSPQFDLNTPSSESLYLMKLESKIKGQFTKMLEQIDNGSVDSAMLEGKLVFLVEIQTILKSIRDKVATS